MLYIFKFWIACYYDCLMFNGGSENKAVCIGNAIL